MCVVEILMVLRKASIIRLKCGYLTGNEPNLVFGFVLWRVAINHPLQVIKDLLESCHITTGEFGGGFTH